MGSVKKLDPAKADGRELRVPEQDRDFGRLLAYLDADRVVYWVPVETDKARKGRSAWAA